VFIAKHFANFAAIAEQEKAEPVAWASPHGGIFISGRMQDGDIPLYTHPAPVPAGWLRAVDEAMVGSHLGIADASDSYEVAKKKLNDLICWNIQVATDPSVNGGYQLAPAEPTREMLFAADTKACELADRPKGFWYAGLIYKAMLAAAPKPGDTK
jgi:hypothetical protein